MINTLCAFVKVWWFFKDFRKAWLWFKTPNPLLGGFTPILMANLGRAKKLHKIVSQQLEANKR